MTAIDDFCEMFGKDMLQQVLDAAVNHSEMRSTISPEDEEQRMYFSLLNMIDFECFEYGDAPKGLDQQKVLEFLQGHGNLIKCEPPTYMGLLAGRFDFLEARK